MNPATYSKAIAGAIAGAITLYLAKENIIIADELKNSIEILLSALITGVVVFLAPANRR